MGEWSFADMAGHLLGWRNHTIARLEAAGRGEPEPAAPWPSEIVDDDRFSGPDLADPVTINAWIHEQHAGRSPEQLVGDYDASYDRLIAAIEALPDDMLTDPNALPMGWRATGRGRLHRSPPRGAPAERPRLARRRGIGGHTMDDETVRERATAFCDALEAGDIERATAHMSKELRQNLGEVLALLPLPSNEVTVVSVERGGSGFNVVIRLIGETDEVEIQTRWKERDGEPTIVEASHLSQTARAAAAGEDGAEAETQGVEG